MNRDHLTFEEEQLKFRRLRGLLQPILAMPIFEILLRIKVTELATGRVKVDKLRYSHSPVRNFYNHAIGRAIGNPDNINFSLTTDAEGALGCRETDGTIIQSMIGNSANFESGNGFAGPVNNNGNGIVIGIGTNPESLSDYKLQTIIADGNGAGQMQYLLSQALSKEWAVSGNYWKVITTRDFDNESGSTITIQEIGLYNQMSSSYKFCWMRDRLYGGGQDVDNGDRLTISYEFRTSLLADSSSSSSTSSSSSSSSSSP